MPKATFFNLPAEKRDLITKIAIEEFADNEYPEVSISRIVARAGIAKGSFYQYFADKEDLHVYLVGLILEKKKEMLSLDHPDPYRIGVFRYLRWMMQAGIQFELTYPELTRLGYRVLSRQIDPQTLLPHYRTEALAFYRRLVATGKAQGDIAAEIDDELAAFMFEAIFTLLGQFLIERINARGVDWQGQQALCELPEVKQLFDQTIDILEHGLGAKQTGRHQVGKAPQEIPTALPESA